MSGPHRPRRERLPPRDILVAEEDPQAIAMLREVMRLVFPEARLHLAGTAAQARLMISTLRPDFVVVNLNVADPSPREFIAQARARDALTRVVVVAGHGDDDRLLPALQGGAAGFLLKHNALCVVESQLREIQAGVLPMSLALARQLIRHVDSAGPGATLEPLEVEVLTWAAAGDTLQEVAWRMHTELPAVSAHVQRIYRKLKLPANAVAPPVDQPLCPHA